APAGGYWRHGSFRRRCAAPALVRSRDRGRAPLRDAPRSFGKEAYSGKYPLFRCSLVEMVLSRGTVRRKPRENRSDLAVAVTERCFGDPFVRCMHAAAVSNA